MFRYKILALILFFSLPVFCDCSYEIPLPQEKTQRRVTGLNNMTRDSLLFMTTAFANVDIKEAIYEDSVRFDCNAVALEARREFAKMAQASTYLEAFSMMKAFLKTGAYHRAQTIRHPNFLLPSTLSILEEKLHFKSWNGYEVKSSKVKGQRRIVYRSPHHAPEMSIAQTGEEGSIRETEIILRRDDNSGNYDFYAFGMDGLPAYRSTFFNSNKKETVGPVPHTCMSCHYDGQRRVFQTLPLSFHP